MDKYFVNDIDWKLQGTNSIIMNSFTLKQRCIVGEPYAPTRINAQGDTEANSK